MNKILKVFVSGPDQDKLAKRYTIMQRYEGFVLIQVPEADVEKIQKRYPVEDITDQYILKVGDLTIDTSIAPAKTPGLVGEEAESFAMPAVAPVSGMEDRSAGTPGPHHYLVVFDGPIKSEWLQSITAVGGDLQVPYQNFTYVVKADEAALSKINELPFVRWTGHLPTWARIATALRDRPTLDDASNNLPRTRTLPATYMIEFFDSGDMNPARDPVEQLGAKIVGEDQAGKVMVVELTGNEDERMALLEALAAVRGVRSIRERAIKRISNDIAAKWMGALKVIDTNALGLSGDGEMIGIADTGLDSGDLASIHPDFSGRVVWIKSYPITTDYTSYIDNPGGDDGPADLDSGHGTHVSGSALGSGSASVGLSGQTNLIRGLAYNSKLVFQAIEQEMKWKNPAHFSKYGRFILAGLPLNLDDLFGDAYAQGARIHSDSWGGGDPGAYDTQCEQLDRFIWEHKDFCVFVAAGNDGSDHNLDGQVDPMSVSSPGTAKNCITVGACESLRPLFSKMTYGDWWPQDYPVPPLHDEPIADQPDKVAAFSSRGPTQDGRVKPDLVAPGTFILSTRSTRIAPNNMAWSGFSSSRMYFFMGGTSMSTPLVAGAAGLIREYLRKMQNISNPSAALIKAALIASTRRIKSSAPKKALSDNEQGFGRINLESLLMPLSPSKVYYLDVTSGIETGQSYNLNFEIKSSKVPLRIVMVYTDYPGRSLVNNLNLIARSPTGRLYAGNGQAGKLVLDNKNNIEALNISKPHAGNWQIQIIGANVPNGPQDFAIVYQGDI